MTTFTTKKAHSSNRMHHPANQNMQAKKIDLAIFVGNDDPKNLGGNSNLAVVFKHCRGGQFSLRQ